MRGKGFNMAKYIVIKKPLITEKATNYRESENVYVFSVDKRATKGQIKSAVEEMFKVNVKGVRTVKMSGKFKRLGAHGGYRPDWKKAYVVLPEGQIIKIAE